MLQVKFEGNFNTTEDAVTAIRLFLEKVQEGYESAPLTEDENGNSFSWDISGEEVSPNLSPEEVRAGTTVIMTHEERQAFLQNSAIGELLGWTE